MKKYILKRCLQLIPVLLGITFLSFAMMRVAGSDAITELYGDKGAVAQEVIDAKRAELGLDQPFLTQCIRDLCFQAPGDAASDGAFHRGNRSDLHPAGRSGGGAA